MMRRLLSSVSGGLAALLLARGCGLPLWVDWPTDWSLRDAADVGALVAMAIWFALAKPTPPANQDQSRDHPKEQTT